MVYFRLTGLLFLLTAHFSAAHKNCPRAKSYTDERYRMLISWRKTFRYLIPVLFFVSTLGLSIAVPAGVFVSPDENASGVFSLLFAQEQRLWIDEPFNISLDGILASRSTIAIGPVVLPVSFLGLPVLYGVVGWMFGPGVIWLMTPIIALLAVLAWRSLVLHMWEDARLADMTALALMIHPAFWYYTSRSLMHNVLFVSLLIFASWFWVARPLYKHDRHVLLDTLAAGGCLGLALATRGGEVIWVGVALLALLVWKRAALSWKQVLTFLLGIVIALLPFAALQTALFGAPWEVGYTVDEEVASGQEQETEERQNDLSAFDQWLESSAIGSLVLPFGIHEMNILRNGFAYGALLYPWMTLLAIAGWIILVRDRAWRPWAVVTALVALWLLIVYGSWSFSDNPDPNAITIGDSHVRYWLPAFVLSTPFIGYLLRFALKPRSVFRLPAITTAVLCTALSAHLVFFSPDGVLAARAQLFVDAQKRALILEQAGEGSIVIVDYADKYVFPDRSVVVPLRDERTYASMPAMVALADVYYFGMTFPQQDIDYLNDEKLALLGLFIEPVAVIGEETLYRIQEVGSKN